MAPRSPFTLALALALLASLAGFLHAQSPGRNEPNIAVPAGSQRYVASGMPDRIVASPAQDASVGFAVSWRTNDRVESPLLEIVPALDSPDVGTPRRVRATSTRIASENGTARFHRADIDALAPDTLYMFRVQGDRSWSGWRQLRTAASAPAPLALLYFGDTQNKNVSHVGRVVREAMRAAPDARLALYAGDLVSGGDGVDDTEWGEWFEAAGDLPAVMLVAPAAGNHEFSKEFEGTPREKRVLGRHWPATFALPRNGAPGHASRTTYWFDAQGVRIVVLDGTSALDLGTAQAQADWLEGVLRGNPHPWAIALIHQPLYSPRGRDSAEPLRRALQPVLERQRVDLVLQGHDHTYARRAGERGSPPLPQYVVSVAGPKQYRLTRDAKRQMLRWAEDTQLFQVLRIDGRHLRYQARTATGRLYDAFEIVREADGGKRLVEQPEGRIAPRDCSHRAATLGGRADRCWE